MFERFSKQARQVVVVAYEQAERLGDDRIGDEHMLLAMFHRDVGMAGPVLAGCGATGEAASLALAAVRRGRRPGTEQAGAGDDPAPSDADDADDAAALRAIGIDLDEVRRRAEETFGPGALERGSPPRRRRRIPFTADAKRVIELALRQAVRLRSGHIGSEHILLGLLDCDGVAVQVLRAMEISPDEVRERLLAGPGQEAG